MRYGYARVSSRGQAQDGTSLESQAAELTAHGCTEVVTEAFTGTTAERPRLTELLDKLERGDALLVCKMDRLARSVAAGLELLEELEERGVTVEVLNMGVLTCTPTARLLRTVMLAVAEFERDMIVERMAEGRAWAREHDPEHREGRRTVEYERAGEFLDMVARVEAGELSVSAAARALGVSRTSWYAAVKRIKAA